MEREKFVEFKIERAASPQNQRILRFPIGENGQACLASTNQQRIKSKIIESHAWIKITVHAWLLFVIDWMSIWGVYSDFLICK